MKKLSRDEMKNVMGGLAQCECACTGSTGSWVYTHNAQPPRGSLDRDISTYCPTNQGSCTGCTNW